MQRICGLPRIGTTAAPAAGANTPRLGGMENLSPIPASRAAVLLRPFQRFFEMEAAGGIVLLSAAAMGF